MTQASPTTSMSRKRMLQVCGLVAVAIGVLLLAANLTVAISVLRTLGFVSLLVGVLWLVCARFACDEPMRAAQQRYVREFFPAIIAYMIMVFASVSMMKHVHSIPLKALVALLPVVPIAFVMRAMLHLLLDSDELEQKQQLQAISIAAVSIALLSFAAAFLQTAGLLPIENPLMLVFPGMFFVYGWAMWWVKRKYRGE